jgi:hypothetical protein
MRRDRRSYLLGYAHALRGARTELAALQILREADIQDLRREVNAAKGALRKLEMLDEFATCDRDWNAPLN